MRYNEFIRKQTIGMLENKADRMREEIEWLRRRSDEFGEDHRRDIEIKRSTLSGLKRRIAVLRDYSPDQ